jgi:gas vesicle protein
MNDWLKTLAPLLGTALGGPLGGAAAAFLADKLGIESKTVEAVTEVLNSGKMTPDQIANIKLAELDFKKFTETNKIDVMKVEAADRADARDTFKVTRSRVPAALTFLITVGFFGVLIAMFKWPEVKESAPLMIMLGSLGTAWTGACAFWFGTTNSSADKNQMLANSAPAK